MGKGNTDRRKTTLARLGTVEDVVDDLLAHLETERVTDRLAELEAKRTEHHRAIEAMLDSAKTATVRLTELEDAAGRARESFGTLGHRLETRELWPWQRAGRKVMEWLRTWF